MTADRKKIYFYIDFCKYQFIIIIFKFIYYHSCYFLNINVLLYIIDILSYWKFIVKKFHKIFWIIIIVIYNVEKKKNCIRVIFHWRKKNYIYMHLFFSCSTQLRNYSVTNVRVRLKTSTRVHFVHFFRTNAKCFRNGSAHKHSFFRKKLETRSLKRFLLVPNKSTLKKKKNIYISSTLEN